MRSLIILTILFFASYGVNAQYCPPISGKFGEIKLFHVTAGYGITQMFGDIGENNVLGSAGTIAFDYQLKKGLFVGVEGQFGALNSEVKNSSNPNRSQNNYISGGVRVLMHPFVAFSQKKHSSSASLFLLESLYVGLGTSYVINNYDYVYRHTADYTTYGAIGAFTDDGDPVFKERTRTLVLPSINLGSALPFYNQNGKNLLSLVINAQFNFGQNDLLDGYVPYSSSGTPVNGANDMFNFYSLGLRYSL